MVLDAGCWIRLGRAACRDRWATLELGGLASSHRDPTHFGGVARDTDAVPFPMKIISTSTLVLFSLTNLWYLHAIATGAV